MEGTSHILKYNITVLKNEKNYSNLKTLQTKRNPNTVNFKTETNNISNIYDNLINQTKKN